MKERPPVISKRLLRLILSDEIYHEVAGDFEEVFQDRLTNKGKLYARTWYTIDTLLSFRNYGLRRKLKFYNPLVMYKNYFKIAFRNLLKYKGYSFINIFGLSLGMAACLLILLFVHTELNFDGFHENKSNIYRLDEVQTFGEVSAQKVALTMFPMGPNMLQEYPEVENFTRYWTIGRSLVEVNSVQHYFKNPVRVDSSFLDIFDFNLIRGDKENPFPQTTSLLISESNAQKIFSGEDPVGQQIRLVDADTVLTVAGVFEDVPENSHLQFDALIDTKMWDSEGRRNNWGSNYLNTYLLLNQNTDPDVLEAKFDDFLLKYAGENSLNFYELFLQPLTDVHLGSMDITHDYNNYKKFSRSSVNIFLVLALFVLLIASINFMNLSTARAATRAREVGVRKSVGAFKGQITGQFILESVILTLIALLVAFGICLLALDPLIQIIDRDLSLLLFFQPLNLLIILSIIVLIGLLSGLYPALVMSKFNPTIALKGNGPLGEKSIFRNVLVVFQYAIAIAIIIGTSVATRQLNYMQNLDLGFDKEATVILDMFQDTNAKYDLLKSELQNQPNITAVTATTQRLGNNLHQTSMAYRADTAVIRGSSSFVVIDDNFIDFYGMEVIEGRGLNKDYANDLRGLSFIVNETLAKEIASNTNEVVGTRFHFGGADTLGTIVGIVKDFNYNKLDLKVEPLFMSKQNWGWSEVNIKVRGDALSQSLEEIETVWTSLFPQRPFEYTFLDEHIGQMYQSEKQLTKVISILSGLAIVIASLGLFGLASFTVRQRLKEMGIRKVLGASVGQIVMILSKKFTWLVLIAFAIATPITYYLMNNWLNNYTYKIEIGVLVFVVVGLGSLLIALLTVSLQSIRVAKSNPVETLRIE